MRKSRPTGSPIDQVAGNGLLDRRALLGRGVALAGAMGAGTTNYWVDPVRDITMVCLTTGFLEEANSALRFQRLSDVAIAEFG